MPPLGANDSAFVPAKRKLDAGRRPDAHAHTAGSGVYKFESIFKCISAFANLLP